MLPAPDGKPGDNLLITGGENGAVTVLYPKNFVGWVEGSNHLSASLGVPVVSLHIHDGDLWLYVLF